MHVLHTVQDMTAFSMISRDRGQTLAFVPTMGALHEGHLELIRAAKKKSDLVVVSIFVNPTQFNDPKDYQQYPQMPGVDLKLCTQEKVDVAFVPTIPEIYPAHKKLPTIPLPKVASPLEGKLRPGHFEGVVTVVARLFDIVRPHAALFGLKDYQQLRVIEEMVKEQQLDIEIVRHPIVRSETGLALSSRNIKLSPQGLTDALHLSKSLQVAKDLFQKGEQSVEKIRHAVLKELQHPSITVDDVSVVDPETLQEISSVKQGAFVAVAAFIEGVRLIDNCLLKITS